MTSMPGKALRGLCTVSVATGVALATAGVHAQTFSYSLYTSPVAIAAKAFKVFNQKLEEGTDGRIKFELYPSGTLASAKTTLEAIKNGIADGGGIITIYTPSATPANTLISNLSFSTDESRIFTAAITDVILNDCEVCREEYKKYNVHFLASTATEPYYLMCKGTFENGFDPKGLRIRTPGAIFTQWLKTIGATPVQLAHTEAYQALQTNAIDCSIGTLSYLKAYSWEEVVDSVIDLPQGAYQGGAWYNFAQDKWDKLDPKDQLAMQRAALYGTAAMSMLYQTEGQEAIDEAREKYDVKLIPGGERLARQKQDFFKTEREYAIEQATKHRVPEPEAIITAFHAKVEKWRGLIGDKAFTPEELGDLFVKHMME